jgi:hypothetical protein
MLFHNRKGRFSFLDYSADTDKKKKGGGGGNSPEKSDTQYRPPGVNKAHFKEVLSSLWKVSNILILWKQSVLEFDSKLRRVFFDNPEYKPTHAEILSLVCLLLCLY